MAMDKTILWSTWLFVAMLSTVSAAGEVKFIIDKVYKTMSFDKLERVCLANANYDKLGQLKLAYVKMNECVLPLAKADELQREIDSVNASGNAKVIVEKYCRIWPRVRQCLDPFLELMVPCIEVDVLLDQRMLLNVAAALHEFLCSDDGEPVLRFLGEGGAQCLTEQWPQVRNCRVEKLKQYDSEKYLLTESNKLFVSGSVNCMECKSLQHCFDEQLESCLSRQVLDDLRSMFESAYQAIPCAGSANSAVSMFGLVALVSLLLAKRN